MSRGLEETVALHVPALLPVPEPSQPGPARRARGRARKHPHIYWRDQGGVKRAWADLRAYADVGGKREALKADPEKLATTDPAIAQDLLARRIKEFDARRRGRALHGITDQATLEAFAGVHLDAKAKSAQVTDAWLELAELHLARAVAHFGAERDLASITTADVRAWAEHLRALPAVEAERETRERAHRGEPPRPRRRRETMSDGTIRHHLNTLSNLYRRARAERVVPSGYNPVGDLQEKPTAGSVEAKWLEVPDAALFLEAARTYRPAPTGGRPPLPFPYELVATFLLTGGRESEVLGLEVGDVSLDRGVLTFRPNSWRRLKTRTSHRSVPLWPQLRGILEQYLAARPPSRLLFPSYRTGHEAMVTDCHKLLDAIATRAGWSAGDIRSKMFRHTYCAARLQTVDQGAPVSVYTVAKELGHGGESMVRRVYGHLGQVRQRAEVVEYRIEPYAAKLGDRLARLRSGTIVGTARVDSQPSRASDVATTSRA
jgi:integrase